MAGIAMCCVHQKLRPLSCLTDHNEGYMCVDWSKCQDEVDDAYRPRPSTSAGRRRVVPTSAPAVGIIFTGRGSKGGFGDFGKGKSKDKRGYGGFGDYGVITLGGGGKGKDGYSPYGGKGKGYDSWYAFCKGFAKGFVKGKSKGKATEEDEDEDEDEDETDDEEKEKEEEHDEEKEPEVE
jgi:hypothetical protein